MTRGAPEHTRPIDHAFRAMAWSMVMSLDGAIASVVYAKLLRLGVVDHEKSPSNDNVLHFSEEYNTVHRIWLDYIRAKELVESNQDTELNRLMSFIGDAMIGATNEDSFIRRIDAITRHGIADDAVRILHTFAPNSLDSFVYLDPDDVPIFDNNNPSVHGLAAEAIRCQQHLAMALQVLRDSGELPNDEFNAAAFDIHLDRSNYINRVPRQVANLIIAGERGSIASHYMHWLSSQQQDVQPWHLPFAAKTAIDGATAALRLVASMFPECVSDALVPCSERINISALTNAAEITRKVLQDIDSNKPLAATDFIVERIDDLMCEGRFDFVVAILDSINTDRFTPQVIAAVLMITSHAKDALGETRDHFFNKAMSSMVDTWAVPSSDLDYVVRKLR